MRITTTPTIFATGLDSSPVIVFSKLGGGSHHPCKLPMFGNSSPATNMVLSELDSGNGIIALFRDGVSAFRSHDIRLVGV